MSHDISDNEDGRMSLSDSERPGEPEENNQDQDNQDNSGGEDGPGRRINPAPKKIIRRTIPKLNPARLKGPKGVTTIETYFKGFKFQGKGHEKEDLDRVMKRLEHWAHRLFPKYQFDDFLEKAEALGSKKEIQLHLTKYRRDMLVVDDNVMEEDNEETEVTREKSPEPADEFDLLIAQQITINKQNQTPSQSQTQHQSQSKNQSKYQSQTQTQTQTQHQSQSQTEHQHQPDFPDSTTPAAKAPVQMDDELRQKIERNRQMALEKRLAKMREREMMAEAEAQVVESPEDDVISQIVEDQEAERVRKEKEAEEETRKRIERNRQIAVERRLARMREKEQLGKVETLRPVEVEANGEDKGTKEVGGKEDKMEVECGGDGEGRKEIVDVEGAGTGETSLTRKMMTDEELDREIGDAVEMFTKSSRG